MNIHKVDRAAWTRRDFLLATAGAVDLGAYADRGMPPAFAAANAASNLDDLARSVQGRVLRESSPGYDDARRVWNLAYDRRPLAMVRAANVDDVRRCVEPGINSRFKCREPVLAWHPDMQMGMECPEPVVGHEDFHLADGQVLDVLVLRPGVLDVGFTAESNGLVLFFKHPGALDGQGAPFLRNARRCFQEILRRLLIFRAQ